jgi:hypothetical protein
MVDHTAVLRKGINYQKSFQQQLTDEQSAGSNTVN